MDSILLKYVKKNNLIETFNKSEDKENFSNFRDWFYFWYVDTSWRGEGAMFTQEEYDQEIMLGNL